LVEGMGVVVGAVVEEEVEVPGRSAGPRGSQELDTVMAVVAAVGKDVGDEVATSEAEAGTVAESNAESVERAAPAVVSEGAEPATKLVALDEAEAGASDASSTEAVARAEDKADDGAALAPVSAGSTSADEYEENWMLGLGCRLLSRVGAMVEVGRAREVVALEGCALEVAGLGEDRCVAGGDAGRRACSDAVEAAAAAAKARKEISPM